MVRIERLFLHALLAGLSALMLHGCVSVPEQFRGDFPAIHPQSAGPADVGREIRWGGMILDSQTDESSTCFEILSRPLSSSMRPERSDQTFGRFIACRPGFLDPEVFARGREITLTGAIERLEQRKVGEYDYRYPVVQAGFITMWPKRVRVIVPAYDPFYRPWYFHYPYYYRYPYPHHPWPVRRSIDDGPRVDVPAQSGGSDEPS